MIFGVKVGKNIISIYRDRYLYAIKNDLNHFNCNNLLGMHRLIHSFFSWHSQFIYKLFYDFILSFGFWAIDLQKKFGRFDSISFSDFVNFSKIFKGQMILNSLLSNLNSL